MILSLDVGTSSAKAVLFDHSGRAVHQAESPSYPTRSPRAGWMEQDPEEVWTAVQQVLEKVVQMASDPSQICCMGLSAQSGSLILADKMGDPVYPLITWMDGRTLELVKGWKSQGIEELVRSLSGWSLYPGLPLPTIAWFRENDSDTFEKANHFFSVNDFIAYRLTGERVTNPSNAGGMQLIDLQQPVWQDELCQLAGISSQQLSRIEPSGSPIGILLPEVSSYLGLPQETQLINGGHDQACTALSLGLKDPGAFLLACGTAWVFGGAIINPDLDNLPGTLDVNYHLYQERWIGSQSLGGLGASLAWWLETTRGEAEESQYAALTEKLQLTGPNEDLFYLPATGGHDTPATTRPGGFVGLGLHHSGADLARSVMESAGYELRWALEELLFAGMPVNSLTMVGGAAKSQVWPTILSEITGLPIYLPSGGNWPALGAALLAGTGAGMFSSLEEAVQGLQTSARLITPDSNTKNRYQDIFPKYKQVVDQVRKLDLYKTSLEDGYKQSEETNF